MARSSLIHSTAAAPSLICDELPAVWMPPGITGLRVASLSAVVSRRPWSRVTVTAVPSASVTSTGMISRSKRPSSVARSAFCCEMRPSMSTRSRVMPRRWAMRSAAPNWSGMSMLKSAGFDEPLMNVVSSTRGTLAPSHTLLMCSTPQAMPTSMAPAEMRLAIMWLACCDEPHWQSMVVPAT